MKKLNILKYLWCVIPAILVSCVDDDLADVGDLENVTKPTPFFSFANLSEGTFFCDESLESAHYEYSFTPGSKLAVNGIDYEWSVSPGDNVEVVRKDARILEATIDGLRSGVTAIEEKIATLTKSLDCVDPADTAKIDEINDEIDFLTNTTLPAAQAALDAEPDDGGQTVNEQIADLEAQIAELNSEPYTLSDREFNLVFPGPGEYDVTLTVIDALGDSTDLVRPISITEPVFVIPTPEIGEPSFEDNSKFDGTGDGRDSWRVPSNDPWSPVGGGTTVPQISSTSDDGEQSAKFPGAASGQTYGGRIAYQEIDLTADTKYIISFSSAFDAVAPGTLIFKIVNPDTANFTEALLSANILAESRISNEGRSSKSFARHTLSFESGELESAIILAYVEGTDANTYLDGVQIIVNN